jgi:5'(3')-deoxyribonucleotidase
MKIAVDLDGVLYHWSKTARYMLRTMKGYEEGGPLSTESQTWDYIKDHIKPEDWKWIWTGAVKLGLFRYGHVMQGGVEGIRALHDKGHRLVVVTHRPQQAVGDTIDWLAYVNLPFAGVHILTNQEPKWTVQADLLIDDKPQNLNEWVENTNGWAIKFVQPWNQDIPTGDARIVPVYGWEETVKAVETIDSIG